MFGKKVYALDGPGQSPKEGLAGSEGIIISDKTSRWGEFWIVQWTEGNSAGRQESLAKHSVQPVSEVRGIGVYYE